MIETELSVEPVWPEEDWQKICDNAVAAALAVMPYSALLETSAAVSISVRFSHNQEVHGLNRDYRDKDNPTNILSFPMMEIEHLENINVTADGEILLGDMILAHETCAEEAAKKDIPLAQHISHLIVHGMLHLIGYDHISDIEAEHMEALEVKALASMGIANPYSNQQ